MSGFWSREASLLQGGYGSRSSEMCRFLVSSPVAVILVIGHGLALCLGFKCKQVICKT